MRRLNVDHDMQAPTVRGQEHVTWTSNPSVHPNYDPNPRYTNDLLTQPYQSVHFHDNGHAQSQAQPLLHHDPFQGQNRSTGDLNGLPYLPNSAPEARRTGADADHVSLICVRNITSGPNAKK